MPLGEGNRYSASAPTMPPIPEKEALLLNAGSAGQDQKAEFQSNISADPHNYNDTIPTDYDKKVTKVQFHTSSSVESNAPKLSHHRSRIADMSQVALHKMQRVSTVHMTSVSAKDEDQERGNWSNPIEFFLTCLGYAVGLGNVWRFPYLCYRNGGGAFLIPYLIMLFCCGLPLMLMEMTLGQYSSQGPLSIWCISPLFKGIGISMLIVSCVVNVYYCLITGWCVYYLFMSIRASLPWACCDYDSWASDFCMANEKACPSQSNQTQIMTNMINFTNSSLWAKHVKFSADDYFHRNVLAISDSLTNMGNVQWPILLALFVAWLLVFLVLMKGVKSIGKAVYFSSTFPYLILSILLVRAAIEPGAAEGIKFYLTPKWEKLAEARVWSDAAAQIFYSTGVCFGGTITLASYNKFRNNLYRDAVIVGIGNSLTSIFCGFVVFSILGFMAHSLGVSVDEVATSGPGLTFVTYPQAVAMLPLSPLWSCLFFFMLLTLALSSMFPNTENIVTALIDQFPKQLRPYKFFVTAALCCVLFLLGIPLTTEGGVYLLQLLDTYAVGYSILILGLFEVCVVALRYGGNRMLFDLSQMLGHSVCVGWKVLWCFVTPLLLIFAIVFTIANHDLLSYGAYVYPKWSNALGWLLVLIVLSPIPVYAVAKLVVHMKETGHPLWQSLVFLTCDTHDYGKNARRFLTFDLAQKNIGQEF